MGRCINNKTADGRLGHEVVAFQTAENNEWSEVRLNRVQPRRQGTALIDPAWLPCRLEWWHVMRLPLLVVITSSRFA